MSKLSLVSHSPEETQKLGMRLGELAEAGDVFLLVGDLGSGKTCLTQGVAWGLGIQEYALSPSFVIIR
jgi:tRNA threonylcarbamoyladenosine biosynthesis protein TsaE